MIRFGLVALACVVLAKAAAAAEQPAAKSVEKLKTIATIDLEWEAVAEASGYEDELVPKKAGVAIRFVSEANSIVKRVPIGAYSLRIRSKEATSGIFGAWSEPTDLDVQPKPVALVEPLDEAELHLEKVGEVPIEFKWTASLAGANYTLKVW